MDDFFKFGSLSCTRSSIHCSISLSSSLGWPQVLNASKAVQMSQGVPLYRVESIIWPLESPQQKNREHQKNRWVSDLRRRFNRSLCVQIVAIGVLTQYPGLRHCTGACSVWVSVQPVLKRFTDQLKRAFWNILHPMHRWLILKRRFNRC